MAQLQGQTYYRLSLADSYTLNPYDLNGNLFPQITIDCDSTIGSMSIQLPLIADFNGNYLNFRITVNDIGVASTNPITVYTAMGDFINVDGTSIVNITQDGAGLVIQAISETTWFVNESQGAVAPPLVIQQTNIYYVDPQRVFSYTPTGSILYPFFTISDAQHAIIASGNYGADNPAFICLNNTITENVLMEDGHIFLTASQGTGTHGAPIIYGIVTCNGSALTKIENHFSVSNLRVIAPNGQSGILSTGANPQQVFLSDLWLDASTTGNCIQADNSGLGSTCHLNTGHLAHSGTGDIYCVDVIHGTMTITDIETSGNVQVCAVRAGATCTIDSSELDGNNTACMEVYGGTLVVTRSIITNALADSHGIALMTAGSVAVVGECSFSIPVSATGKCVYNPPATAPTYLVYQYVSFINPSNPLLPANRGLSATITASALATTFVP